MSNRIYRRLLALCVLLAHAGTSHGQATLGVPRVLPTEPTAASAPANATYALSFAPLWKLDPVGAGLEIGPAPVHAPGCGAGPGACAPYEDRNGPLLIGNPLLDYPPGTPGWVTGLDVGIVVPHIKNRLTEPVTLSTGVSEVVHLPTADLGVRAMPKLELGYRFGQAAGELLVSYRFLVADGTQLVSGSDLPVFAPGGGAALRSRLDLQIFDIDYANYEPSLGPQWDMKWRIGVRGMFVYNDSQGANAFLYQQTTNRFWGIGPHASLDLRRWIADTGLAVFGRVDSSLPIGRLTQNFVDVHTPAGGGETGEARLFQNMPQVTLAFQLGLTWSPGRRDNFRMTAGYYYEHFWDTGAIGVVTGSTREELSIQGGFLRAEWNY